MVTPRLGAVQPVGYTCVREVGANFGDQLCGAPASAHIRWDEQGEHAPACEAHAGEAIERFGPFDWHDLSAECMTPGSVWIFGELQGMGFCSIAEAHPDLAALESPPVGVDR